MSKIIEVDFKKTVIQPDKLSREIMPEMIKPSEQYTPDEVIVEHSGEPIKKPEDIYRISNYLIENKRYRDNMLFIVGINFGLRVSDLVRLRFADLINSDLTFKTTFPILEKKTKNTRKVKKNRYLTINDAVMDAVVLFLKNKPSALSDYMFRSESNRGKNNNNPLDRKSVERILKGISEDLNLEYHVTTHSLRKTFGYHQMLMANNDPRKLLLLQRIFGHSSVSQTLTYIGITQEEIESAYKELNLGLISLEKIVNTEIKEQEIALA